MCKSESSALLLLLLYFLYFGVGGLLRIEVYLLRLQPIHARALFTNGFQNIRISCSCTFQSCHFPPFTFKVRLHPLRPCMLTAHTRAYFPSLPAWPQGKKNRRESRPWCVGWQAVARGRVQSIAFHTHNLGKERAGCEEEKWGRS